MLAQLYMVGTPARRSLRALRQIPFGLEPADRVMIIRRELAKVGKRALVQTEFVGVSGQVCSIVYELTGPSPQHFTDFSEAQRALALIDAGAASARASSWTLAV